MRDPLPLLTHKKNKKRTYFPSITLNKQWLSLISKWDADQIELFIAAQVQAGHNILITNHIDEAFVGLIDLLTKKFTPQKFERLLLLRAQPDQGVSISEKASPVEKAYLLQVLTALKKPDFCEPLVKKLTVDQVCDLLCYKEKATDFPPFFYIDAEEPLQPLLDAFLPAISQFTSQQLIKTMTSYEGLLVNLGHGIWRFLSLFCPLNALHWS